MSNSGVLCCGPASDVAGFAYRLTWHQEREENGQMNDVAGTVATSLADNSGAACIARARGLIPLLQAAADRIDADNALPPDVLDAMHKARMFKLLLPRTFGGAELKPIDFIQCGGDRRVMPRRPGA
jgi:alkylation response protein AidB-like acyl-CoA dehydrogenase